jgi:hypothetical protein
MREAAYYREKAAHFREVARDSDAITAAALIGLAEDYEAEARRLEPDMEPPMPPVT